MPADETLHDCYDSLLREGERLAGGLSDLAQRATVYHHIYEHSGRNHIFPLIAAHGAMWARGYFRFGMSLARFCSIQYALSPATRKKRLQQIETFADAFRDVNRRVCVVTYTTYHFTRRFGEHPDANQLVPRPLLVALNRCHAARRQDQELSTNEKRNLFQTFFLDEQETVVGPQIQKATEAFDWQIMKIIALKPLIRFSYFGRRLPFWFRDFANKDERIEKGFNAFDVAAKVGWDRVEAALREYKVLPDAFFADSKRHFANIRESLNMPVLLA